MFLLFYQPGGAKDSDWTESPMTADFYSPVAYGVNGGSDLASPSFLAVSGAGVDVHEYLNGRIGLKGPEGQWFELCLLMDSALPRDDGRTIFRVDLSPLPA